MAINTGLGSGLPSFREPKRITIRRVDGGKPYAILGTDIKLCQDAETILKELDEICVGDEITYELICVRKQRKCKTCDGKGVY